MVSFNYNLNSSKNLPTSSGKRSSISQTRNIQKTAESKSYVVAEGINRNRKKINFEQLPQIPKSEQSNTSYFI